MSGSPLYDDDILIWSEEQARIIRGLGSRRRDLPNELDVENVAEEIESVGRSELAAVKSHLHNILLHLMKLALEPQNEAARHWRGELLSFHAGFRSRYAPSMHQRIDINDIWDLARRQVLLVSDNPEELERSLPEASPLSLDEFLVERIDPFALPAKVQQTGRQPDR